MTEANKHNVAVFACGLPRMCGREKIYKWLKKFGYIAKLDLPKGPGKTQNRGYGYVHFADPSICDKLIEEREFKFKKYTIIFEPYGDRRHEDSEKDFLGSEGVSFESEEFTITRSPSPASSPHSSYFTDSDKPTSDESVQTIKPEEKIVIPTGLNVPETGSSYHPVQETSVDTRGRVIPDEDELVFQDIAKMLDEIKANTSITWQTNQNFCLDESYFSSKKLFYLYHNFLMSFYTHVQNSNCGITVITAEIHDSYFSTIGNIWMNEIIGVYPHFAELDSCTLS